jgi:hypothetical protein
MTGFIFRLLVAALINAGVVGGQNTCSAYTIKDPPGIDGTCEDMNTCAGVSLPTSSPDGTFGCQQLAVSEFFWPVNYLFCRIGY